VDGVEEEFIMALSSSWLEIKGGPAGDAGTKNKKTCAETNGEVQRRLVIQAKRSDAGGRRKGECARIKNRSIKKGILRGLVYISRGGRKKP